MAKLWDKIGSKVHLGLGAAGMVPGIGNIADLIDAGIYSAEGDKLGAGLSLAAAVPGLGLAAGGTKLLKGAKGMKGVKDLEKFKEKWKATKALTAKLEPAKKLLSNKERVAKFGLKSVDSKLVDRARALLRKELLSDESYIKWLNMMKTAEKRTAAGGIMLKGGKHNLPSKAAIEKQLLRIKMKKGLEPYSREVYNKAVSKAIDKTPVYEVPDNLVKKLAGKLEEAGEELAGWYTHDGRWKVQELGAVYIPSRTLKTGASRDALSTIVHELKHSVQAPFRKEMNTIYDDMLYSMNRGWRREKQKYTDMAKGLSGVKTPLKPEVSYNKYVRTGAETSARLSEVRAGKTIAGIGEGAKFELIGSKRAFDPRELDWLLKNVWGVAPVGAMLTGKQRWDKAFGEEE